MGAVGPQPEVAAAEDEINTRFSPGLGIELLTANTVFVLYAAIGLHWKLEAAVIDVWLAQTVVQVVGIVLVVTRHLFPEGAGKS